MTVWRIILGERQLKATLLLAWLGGVGFAFGETENCPRCGWAPPRTSHSTTVRTADQLRRAIKQAQPRTTILLEDGTYHLAGNQLDVGVPRLVLRGKRGRQARVLIRGQGMNERMVAISISAPDVTVADLRISQVGYHGIQIRGERGASGAVIHHVHILDTGQQLIKGSMDPFKRPCRNGLVACSTLEYTDSAPSDYTNGIDVLNGEGWVVRDNILRRIRGPREQGFRAGPAILFWGGSRDTAIERNWIVDCCRGIALGLLQVQDKVPDRLDHKGGIIRRNALCNLNSWADEGIEVNASPGTRIEHNTVLSEGKVPWAISVRFPSARAEIWNNLCNRRIVLRDGAMGDLRANVVTAERDWFVDAGQGDLRLDRNNLPAIDAGTVIPNGRETARDGTSFSGSAPDVGAFEYRGGPR